MRKDEDYVVNQPQMDHLVDVVEFFLNTTEDCTGSVGYIPTQCCRLNVMEESTSFEVQNDDDDNELMAVIMGGNNGN